MGVTAAFLFQLVSFRLFFNGGDDLHGDDGALHHQPLLVHRLQTGLLRAAR